MLKTLLLKFGAGDPDEPLRFSPGPMTVFVGPNNSGKSLALREVEELISGTGDAVRRIVARATFQLPPESEIERMLRSRAVPGQGDDATLRVLRLRSPGEFSRRRATDSAHVVVDQEIDLAGLLEAVRHLDDPGIADFDRVCREFVGLFTLRLDGQTRLALTQPQAVADLESHPTNHLSALFHDDEARAQIREITADAFGMHFVLDATNGTLLRVRMSTRPPLDSDEEEGADDRSQAFHGRAVDVAEMSDGIRAFTGLTAAVLSADYRVMLVDEPEAFLHPPLTRKLGKRLTQLAAERGANVLAATHSPDFVMGCIGSGLAVNIVRLTYREGVAGARLLAAEKLEAMMRDPLLRSTGVLGALFHEGGVVCESDADRVFYNEINDRLLADRSGGADGVVFLNAQNKQTVRRIVRPLREMGLPAAAVLDLDLLKGREDFRDLLGAAFVPEVFWAPWEEHRRRLHQQLSGADYKDGGLLRLQGEHRREGDALLAALAEYGIFLVPVGELECWMSELEVGGHGPEWLTQVFHKMGMQDQQPGRGGVWGFMRQVAEWIADPRRKGMRADAVPVERRLAAPRRRKGAPAPAESVA